MMFSIMGKIIFLILAFVVYGPIETSASYRLSDFKAHPPIHMLGNASTAPHGIMPDQIKKVYNLPPSGGHGTIAIIGAYDDPTIEKDLGVFSAQFGLPACTSKNGCFEKHPINSVTKTDGGWSYEASLDVEWSHAVAPRAKILLVEAKTPSGTNLLSAIDYARKRADVVAVSMSWGGSEFSDETKLESHFTSDHDITFFASSGDDGAGASWPAASPRVVAVGGTTINLSPEGNFLSEKAWSGSGGGVSAYEKQPAYQAAYSIPRARGMRAIPDVSYDADPQSGFSVYKNPPSSSSKKGSPRSSSGGAGWYVFGGTSAGAPQWAAIKSLGLSASNANFYTDKATDANAAFFRDIVSGKNGTCAYYCTARKHYDYVTGLGSPLTENF